VELDVVGGSVEQQWVVLELSQTAIAVETQQSPHGSGGVVMVDVDGRRSLAYGA
jgi:hypothetical protein